MSRRIQILVIEDEPAQRYVLRQYLANEGYDVLEAADGDQGLQMLRHEGVDLALVDVMLPGLNGIELVRLVRQEMALPIILVTALGGEQSRRVGLDAGADDYIVKPFPMSELLIRVSNLLHEHPNQA